MLKKIATKDLRLGMFVADVGRSWFNHPWKTGSKLLGHQEEIDQLVEYGITEVTVDTDKSQCDEEPAPALKGATPDTRKASEPISEVELEMPKAAKAYGRALDTSKALVAACRMNKKIEIAAVEENVNELVESVSRNRDALMALMKLRHFDDYTYTHSLNVSVLAISTGKSLGLGEADLRNLGLGTMFHDLGKSRVPSHILNKAGKLTDAEFAIMRQHAALSGEIINEQRLNVDDIVFKIARHHHERIDGSGYPDSLRGQGSIPHLVTICGLADIYDAMSSDRVYHKGISPHEALKFIYTLRGSHFQSEWVDRFVQSVGIYPPGTIVQLNSNQVAVVMEVNAAVLHAPLIKVIADPTGLIYTRPQLLNLADAIAGKDLKIKKVLSREEAGLDAAFYFNPNKP